MEENIIANPEAEAENSKNNLSYNECTEDNCENKEDPELSNNRIINDLASQEINLDIEKDEQSRLLDTQASVMKEVSNDKQNINKEETNKTNNSTSIHYIKEIDCYFDSTDAVSRISPIWKQFISASGALALFFAAGMSSGYSATLLSHLREERNPILENETSASWIASIVFLPMAPCCFIGGWLIEKFGRRRVLGKLGIPVIIGWLVIILAKSFTQMLIGRFIIGCSLGIMMPTLSVFISESSSPKLRGMFLSSLPFSFSFAIFVSHLIGTWASWQTTAIISAVCPLISVIILIFVPESPVWLLSKGKIDDGIKAFNWLRGRDENARLELKAMLEKFKVPETIDSTQPWSEIRKKFYSPEFYKPLFITVTIYLTCQFSGIHSIAFYSIDIMETAASGVVDRYIAMLIIDALRALTTLIAIFCSKNSPRRLLFTLSGSITAASLIGFSSFIYFYEDHVPSHLSSVPLCLLCMFIIAVHVGLYPLPIIIVGEIFPANVRSYGAGITTSVGLISLFIVVKTAPGMMMNLGLVFTFLFYGIVSLVGTIIIFFTLPETKDKSLLEIEAIFKRKSISNSA